MIYRSSVPVSSNGAMTLCLAKQSLYAGSGDGKLKKLQGSDLEWEEIGKRIHVQLCATERCLPLRKRHAAETSLAGKVVAITVAQDEKELLVGTSAGKMYRYVQVLYCSRTQVISQHRPTEFGPSICLPLKLQTATPLL